MASEVSYVETPTPAFLFDLDGTLIDSVYAAAEMLARIDELGVRVDQD